MHLAVTDYKDALANEPSPLSTSVIGEKCTRQIVRDFESLRVNAAQPLAKFLDYITCAPSVSLRLRSDIV
jgi:V-type H+-transporting ATPase subunit d